MHGGDKQKNNYCGTFRVQSLILNVPLQDAVIQGTFAQLHSVLCVLCLEVRLCSVLSTLCRMTVSWCNFILSKIAVAGSF